MHGVPADLPLESFIGDTLTQICIGEFQQQFHFSSAGTISVEGNWELCDSNGDLFDRAMEQGARQTYRIHVLLGQRVVRFSLNSPKFFSLHFLSGHALTIFDSSARYESFSVNGIHV